MPLNFSAKRVDGVLFAPNRQSKSFGLIFIPASGASTYILRDSSSQFSEVILVNQNAHIVLFWRTGKLVFSGSIYTGALNFNSVLDTPAKYKSTPCWFFSPPAALYRPAPTSAFSRAASGQICHASMEMP
jgi:hypothetical protein